MRSRAPQWYQKRPRGSFVTKIVQTTRGVLLSLLREVRPRAARDPDVLDDEAPNGRVEVAVASRGRPQVDQVRNRAIRMRPGANADVVQERPGGAVGSDLQSGTTRLPSEAPEVPARIA